VAVAVPATPAGADPVDPAAPRGAATPDAGTPDAGTSGAAASGAGAPEAGTAGAATAGAAPGAAAPARAPASVAALLTSLQRLYQQAEEASEAYNATAEELGRRRAETKQLGTGLTKARTVLARSRGDVGRLAREQYQGRSDLSGYLQLLLAHDPQHALDERHLLERAGRDRVATMARLSSGEKAADALAAKSRRALGRQQVLATKQRKQRDTVQARLREVEKLLATLSARQIAALAALEQAGTDKAQQKLVTSGALGKGAGARAGKPAPSAKGDEALTFAAGQIGKPYEWGAQGPGSFDCSGLTSQAWAHAGVTIPRTSQEQWRALPRVELAQLRPGDLVIYYPKATHVAIYLGDGMVIQAPRPGARVKVSPIAANPLLGAVRPDPAAKPLAGYQPPVLRPAATDGSDLAAGADTAPQMSAVVRYGAR
jgi:cell wall-associated NlpC family hydrolase